MKRISLIAAIAVAAAGLVGAFATSSYAFPALGQPCSRSGCHAATDPRIAQPDGAQSAFATTTPDATCAVSVCDAAPAYRGDAVMHISATDNIGGWGVGYIYYKFDKGLVRMVKAPVDWTALTGAHSCATTLTIAAPATGVETHTLKFWSQDNYGNVEASQSVMFTVAARTAMPMPIALSRSAMSRGQVLAVSGSVAKPGVKVSVFVKRPGTTRYVLVTNLTASSAGKWSCTFKPTVRGYFYFKATFAGDSEWLPSGSVVKRVYVK